MGLTFTTEDDDKDAMNSESDGASKSVELMGGKGSTEEVNNVDLEELPDFDDLAFSIVQTDVTEEDSAWNTNTEWLFVGASGGIHGKYKTWELVGLYIKNNVPSIILRFGLKKDP